MSYAPSAACRPVQKAVVKRVLRSETSTSGSPTGTSRNTYATNLRAAVIVTVTVSEVAVLKIGTIHTRPLRRSICTCKKSWPERATALHLAWGSGHRARDAWTRGPTARTVGRWSALTR